MGYTMESHMEKRIEDVEALIRNFNKVDERVGTV